MKTASVTTLKANLSRYLKRAQKGERIVIMARNEAIAELVPPPADPKSNWERLVREGKIIPGKGNLAKLKFTRVKMRGSIQEDLQWVRGDR